VVLYHNLQATIGTVWARKLCDHSEVSRN